MIYITKFDGSRQPFQKEKIVRTCLRMHVSADAAEEIAEKIEKKVYTGMPTKKIMRLIIRYLSAYRPEIKQEIDLREAISMLRPMPDFEQFVGLLLKAYGYEIRTNQIVAGKCVEHEIDAVATKNNETLLVEVKHHYQPHTYTSVSVFLETQASFEDLIDGYKEGENRIDFKKILIVCNTKFSDHAKRYAICKNIEFLGWKSPVEKGLEAMIEEKKLYPITFMKNLDKRSAEAFGNANIILLKQLIETDFDKLFYLTEIPKDKLKTFVDAAKEILG